MVGLGSTFAIFARNNVLLTYVLSMIALIDSSPSKTVLISGGNRGIGFNAARALLGVSDLQFPLRNTYTKCDWKIILACRSTERGLAARQKLFEEARTKKIDLGGSEIVVENLDLTDLNSVKAFASRWGRKPLDCLALNAGIQASTKTRTVQGFESTVGTNHIGHFHLLQLLLPNVKAARQGRVVFVGSGVHNPQEAGGNVGSAAALGSMIGLENGFREPVWMIDGGPYDSDKTYKDSKLCNVVTSLELARRLKAERSAVSANCMNPGLIPTTGLFREFNPIFVQVFSFLTRNVFKVAATGVHPLPLLYFIPNLSLLVSRGRRWASPRLHDRQHGSE